MKKKLIEVKNLDAHICQANGRIYVDNTMILTPGARDELSKRKITIERDPKPEFPSCGAPSCPARLCNADLVAPASTDDTGVDVEIGDAETERLFYGVAAMVKEEYGIDDPRQLKDISCKIVDVLKQTI